MEPAQADHFFAEMKSHPEIWNTSNSNYKNLLKREHGWYDIANNIIPDFSSMDSDNQKKNGMYI